MKLNAAVADTDTLFLSFFWMKSESRYIYRCPNYPHMVMGCHQGIYLKVLRHLGPKNKFIHCHRAQTTLPLWNISQRVCYKLQNLHLADTFISPSVRSICFCLCLHFSVLSRSVKWIFSLSLLLSCFALTSFHLLLSFYVSLPSSFSSTPEAAFLLDLCLLVGLCCLSLCFFVSLLSLLLGPTLTSLCSHKIAPAARRFHVELRFGARAERCM